jgi:hypothetical protein
MKEAAKADGFCFRGDDGEEGLGHSTQFGHHKRSRDLQLWLPVETGLDGSRLGSGSPVRKPLP